jgi:hypothetical protein
MMRKRGLEFGFAWIFAILVGGVLISLAIYATSSIIKIERETQDTVLGREFGIILSPVETSLENGKITPIEFSVETRVINDCFTSGSFGKQEIRTAASSGVGKEFENFGLPSTHYNKYLFSDKIVQGDKMLVLSKTFNYPFRVADIIILWNLDKRYCFVSPPGDIENELKNLNPENIAIVDTVSSCVGGDEVVCFGLSDRECDVRVSLESKRVEKVGGSVYYSEEFSDDFGQNLLYGAIFSDPDIYECQIERLMKRVSELAKLHLAKTEYLSPLGCSSNLEIDLISLSNIASGIDNSVRLRESDIVARELGRKNDILICKLF